MNAFTESIVESAALAWLEAIGWVTKHGNEIAPGQLWAERDDYGQVVLEKRLRDALVRLNSTLPPEALEEAYRKLTRIEGATLEARNRSVHLSLVDGVNIEYRASNGEIRGAQARIVDFENPENNDWLAVNQFSVSENKHVRRPDIILFINGLPLVILELKNAVDENADIWTAFNSAPDLPCRTCPPFSASTNCSSCRTRHAERASAPSRPARSGSNPGGRSRASAGDKPMPELQVMIEGVFDRQRLLDMLTISSCSRMQEAVPFKENGGVSPISCCQRGRFPRP
jgi:type I restriction enzyme R subunit